MQCANAYDSVHPLPIYERDYVNYGHTAGVPGRVGSQFERLEGKDAARVSKKEQHVVRVTYADMPHRIVVAHAHTANTFASTVLIPICASQDSLDIATLAQSDDDLFVGFKLLASELLEGWSDLRPAFLTMLPLECLRLFLDLGVDLLGIRQQLFKFTNECL